MRSHLGFVGWAVVAAVLAAADAPAQSDPLAGAELRLNERLTEARRTVVEEHVRQLEVLQRRLSPNRDAEKIKKVEEEIARARKVLDEHVAFSNEGGDEPADDSTASEEDRASQMPPEGSVTAAGAAAEVSGAVNYNRGSRSLVFWYRKGDSAVWTLEDVPEGDYRIFVVYSAVGNISGMELTMGKESEDLDFPNTGGVGNYQSLNLMPYRSAGGELRLEVAVTEDDPRRRCRIRGIVLTPEDRAQDIEGALDLES